MLPERKSAVAKSQWVVSITLDVEGLPPVEYEPLRFTDSYAAKNPNLVGEGVAKFIHEKAARRTAEDARARKARKR